MLVEIAGFSQDMDFSDGSVTNFVTLRLPSGTVVKAIVSDDGARQLIEARAAAGGLAPAASPPVPPQEPHGPMCPPPGMMDMGDDEEEEDDVVVFGGDDAPSSSSSENGGVFMPNAPNIPDGPVPSQSHPYQHHDPATQQRLYRQHQAELKKRAKQGPTMGRTVPKDDRGYPIVAGNGGVDPNTVVGGGGSGVDEDGVGQF